MVMLGMVVVDMVMLLVNDMLGVGAGIGTNVGVGVGASNSVGDGAGVGAVVGVGVGAGDGHKPHVAGQVACTVLPYAASSQ